MIPITGVSFGSISSYSDTNGADLGWTTWIDDDKHLIWVGDGIPGTPLGGNANLTVGEMDGAGPGVATFSALESWGRDYPEPDGQTHGGIAISSTEVYQWHIDYGVFDQFRVMKSTDGGANWTDNDTWDWAYSEGVTLFHPCQFGKAMGNQPAHADGYVWLYFLDTGGGTATNVYLARCAVGSLMTKASYEYWDGAGWDVVGNKAAVYTHGSGIGWGIAPHYIHALQSYVLNIPVDINGDSEWMMLQGPKPWGPFTVVPGFPMEMPSHEAKATMHGFDMPQGWMDQQIDGNGDVNGYIHWSNTDDDIVFYRSIALET